MNNSVADIKGEDTMWRWGMSHYAKNVLTKLIMMMIFMIILGDDDATAADDDNCRWGTVNFYIIIIFILLSLSLLL